MRERTLRKTLSAITPSTSFWKPTSTPSHLTRSCSLPFTNLLDSSETAIDMLSLQALHYQGMGLYLNLEPSALDKEEQSTCDIYSASENHTNDKAATPTLFELTSIPQICQEPGKQGPSGENETLQGVLSIIESAVYPHCRQDTASISSCSNASAHDDSEQGIKTIKSEVGDQKCVPVIYAASDGATQVLRRSGSNTCATSYDAIDNAGNLDRNPVGPFITGKEAEAEIISTVTSEDVQLHSHAPGLLLQRSNRKQDEGPLDASATTQAAAHFSSAAYQSPKPLIASLKPIPDSQIKEQTGKHSIVLVHENVESLQIVAPLQQDNEQRGVSPTLEMETRVATQQTTAPSSCGQPFQSKAVAQETTSVHGLTTKSATVIDKEIATAQEISKSPSSARTRPGSLARESTLVQLPDTEKSKLPPRACLSKENVTIASEPEATRNTLLTGNPREVSNAIDKMRDRIYANPLKRSYTGINASEVSRKKPQMDSVDQQSLDQFFRDSKRRGSPQSTFHPLPTITLPFSAPPDRQQETNFKRRKLIDGGISAQRSQLPNLQDARRNARKIFSMPIPEYTLFYPAPTVRPSISSRQEQSDATDIRSAPLKLEKSNRSEMPAVVPDYASEDLTDRNVQDVPVQSLGAANVKVSSNVRPKAISGLSRDGVAAPDYSQISSSEGCFQPLAIPGKYPEERSCGETQRMPLDSCRPGEKDWNGASFISQESQMDNLLEGDVTTQASDPPDEDIFITKKPLVVFTKFRRPQKNIVNAVGLKAETSCTKSSIGTSTPGKPSTEPYPAFRQVKALEKLKRPFKSPLMTDEKLRTHFSSRASTSMNTSSSSLSGMMEYALPSDIRTPRMVQGSISQNHTGPEHLHSERIVTRRLASSFAAPFSSPLKESKVPSHPSANWPVKPSLDSSFSNICPKNRCSSGISLSGEIAALERRKQNIKQAIKIKFDDQEKHLQELVYQWKQAGRDIVELLYPIVPQPEPRTHMESNAASLWDTPAISTSRSEEQEIESVGGIRQDTEMVAQTQESRDWNYGTMMLSLQVDPQLLDWNEATEDWDMQC